MNSILHDLRKAINYIYILITMCHFSSVKIVCFPYFVQRLFVWCSLKEKPEEENYSKYTAEMTNALGSVLGFAKAVLWGTCRGTTALF